MQQIDLLVRPPPGPRLSARLALGLVTLFAVGLLGQGLWTDRELRRLQQDLTGQQAQRQQLQAELEQLRSRLGERDAAHARLHDAASARELRWRQALADHLGKGELGSLVSPAPVLDLLARHRSERLWLTAVSLTQAGAVLRLEGQALAAEPVLDYAVRLSGLLEPLGARIGALELDAPVSTDAAGPGVYTFRIQ